MIGIIDYTSVTPEIADKPILEMFTGTPAISARLTRYALVSLNYIAAFVDNGEDRADSSVHPSIVEGVVRRFASEGTPVVGTEKRTSTE